MVPHISLKVMAKMVPSTLSTTLNAPQGTGIGDARINGKDRGYPNTNSNKLGGRKNHKMSLASVFI